MKDIGKWIGKALGLIFGAVVIGYTAWLTYSLAARLVPGNVFLQVMTVALFDVGALVWFVLFVSTARGTAQWAVSVIGFMIGLLGAVIMAGGELVLGQQLVLVENTEQIGWLLIATVIVAALTHASLTYAFHFLDPEVRNRIETQQRISAALQKGVDAGLAQIDQEAEAMGQDVANSLLYEARAALRAAALPHLRSGTQIETRTNEQIMGGLIIPGAPARTFAKDVPFEFDDNEKAEGVNPNGQRPPVTPDTAAIFRTDTGRLDKIPEFKARK